MRDLLGLLPQHSVRGEAAHGARATGRLPGPLD